MRVNQQPAIILHTRAYRESSLLVDAFSREFGRVTLNAKGARRNKVRWRNSLQVFQPYLLSWSSKGELAVLTNTEYQTGYFELDYRSKVCAYYANELLSRTLQRTDPHPSLFDAYLQLLGELLQAKQREIALRRFEKALLNEIGYALILERDAESGQPIQDEMVYRYVPELGPVQIQYGYQRQANYSEQYLAGSHFDQWESAYQVSGLVLNSIAKDHYRDDCVMFDAKQFMRVMLKPLLGQKPLMSRRLLYQLKT